MILTLDDVKTQLRLEPDFTEHDDMLTKMVAAAQKSIERDYYCKLVGSDDELQALPEGVRGFQLLRRIRHIGVVLNDSDRIKAFISQIM